MNWHVRWMYQLCCRHMYKKVWIRTRLGRWYHGQIVGVDERNVYLRPLPWPCPTAGGGRRAAEEAVGRGVDAGVSIQEAQFRNTGILALSLFSILAIALTAPRFGFYGGYGYW
ncbi:MAG: hypothetical protein C0P68_000370 [Bacillota bacterium]